MGSPGAIFFDRDGVINENVLNPHTGEFESPHVPDDLRLAEGVLPGLRRLIDHGFPLFLVSNQPSYAKGKTSLENIFEIHRRLDVQLKEAGVLFQRYFYCYHHPQGHVPGYSGPCACRKPSPFFLFEAQRDHGLDLTRSWMVGDRSTDIECGQRAGCRTLFVLPPYATNPPIAVHPTAVVQNVSEAVEFILKTPT